MFQMARVEYRQVYLAPARLLSRQELPPPLQEDFQHPLPMEQQAYRHRRLTAPSHFEVKEYSRREEVPPPPVAPEPQVVKGQSF